MDSRGAAAQLQGALDRVAVRAQQRLRTDQDGTGSPSQPYLHALHPQHVPEVRDQLRVGMPSVEVVVSWLNGVPSART